jgi:hypothetical protein
MTITIKRSTAVIAIALIGILGGLTLGQVTQALSSSPKATASYTAPFEITLKEVNRNLKSIKNSLGTEVLGHTVLTELEKIRGNTYGICQNTGGSAYCHGSF